jgi:hypothetical protein
MYILGSARAARGENRHIANMILLRHTKLVALQPLQIRLSGPFGTMVQLSQKMPPQRRQWCRRLGESGVRVRLAQKLPVSPYIPVEIQL